MTEDVGEIFVVAAETKTEGPLVWEALAKMTGRDDAIARAKDMANASHIIRVAVFRLEFEWGNELVPHDIKRMQR